MWSVEEVLLCVWRRWSTEIFMGREGIRETNDDKKGTMRRRVEWMRLMGSDRSM